MQILAISSDGYNELIPSFLILLKKYWPGHGPLNILGYGDTPKFLDTNINYISADKKSTRYNYSTSVKKALSRIDDDIILMLLVKHFITKDVKKDLLNEALDLINKPDTGKVWLGFNIDKKGLEGVNDFWLWNKSCNHGTCLIPGSNQPSLWKKDFYFDIIKDGWDYLEQEQSGTLAASKQKKWKIFFHKTEEIIPMADATTAGKAIDKHVHKAAIEVRNLFPEKGWIPGNRFIGKKL